MLKLKSKKRVKGVFFKFGVEVGVEESIVNDPLILKHRFFKLQIKNTNKAKSEVRFKQLIRVVVVRSQSTLQRQLRRQILKNTRNTENFKMKL
jgi:hypothetical protein